MKNLKTILAVFCAICVGQILNGQEKVAVLNGFDRIGIAPFVSDQVEYLPAGAKSNLQSKLGQIITANGFGNSIYNTRFILTPNIQVTNKQVVAGAPPRLAITLDVHLFVGDGLEGTKFGSTTVTVKGVGSNENKAYIQAIKQLKTQTPEIKRLISSAKERILDYYKTQCDFIIKEAEVAAAQNDFDEALYILSGIPNINNSCYQRATSLIGPVYQKKIDQDCKINLQNARNLWNTSQDYEGAVSAVQYLATIEPSSMCFRDAQRLSNQIGQRIRQIDDREWNFVLKDQNLQEQKIEAARAIGVAYGQNQPQNMMYNLRGWW